MSNSGSTIIEKIDRLKGELDALRPLPTDVVGRIEQKLRLDSNYHSNAIEGNSLTLGETRSLILHGLTAHGKPMRDHLDIVHLKAARGEDREYTMSNITKGAVIELDNQSPAGEKDKTACTVIDKLVGDIVKSVNPLQIILFGSAARGDAGEHSDIDLLVVMPEGVHRRRTAQKLYREITGLGVPFDIVVATPQDLEKHRGNRGLIYKSALKEGIEIYGL